MRIIIDVSNLSKTFGKKIAVNGISFTVNQGEVFGLLGPNGSGKTTTLGMILTLLKPTSGNITLFGSTDLSSGLKRMGVITENAGHYLDLSARRNLMISAKIRMVSSEKIDEVLERVGLTEEQDNKVKTFSLGMKQRLSVASALLSDPELMLFDEPTNGLDPQGIADFRNLILELSAAGKTVLVASHLLSEMEKVCTHVAIMKKGTLLEQGELKCMIKNHTTLENFFLSITK